MKYGIMQGRLLPRPYPKLQEFPHDSWQKEFALAREMNISCIEWIFEAEKFEENPIWTSQGRNEIVRVIKETGMIVSSLCADYFLVNPLHRDADGSSIEVFKQLLPKASEIGVSLILLPVLEEAELQGTEEREKLINTINSCSELLRKYKMRIGLETELPASEYLSLVQAFNNEHVGVYYDTGNCASRGHDMKQDFQVLLPYLFGVHIKDRKVNGPSVYIGEGDTNFKEGIPFLKSNNYQGNLIFQSFFEDNPIEEMRKSIKVITDFMEDKHE
jgi:sugar phosphate isomerase/epimerase